MGWFLGSEKYGAIFTYVYIIYHTKNITQFYCNVNVYMESGAYQKSCSNNYVKYIFYQRLGVQSGKLQTNKATGIHESI
jgi:hypothetical protein